MAAPARRKQPVTFLPGVGAAANRACQAFRIYSRRIPAGDGSSIFWLLGLSGYRLLRRLRTLWHAPGLDVSDRYLASERHRRNSRLGAVTLPDRRARPRI